MKINKETHQIKMCVRQTKRMHHKNWMKAEQNKKKTKFYLIKYDNKKLEHNQ